MKLTADGARMAVPSYVLPAALGAAAMIAALVWSARPAAAQEPDAAPSFASVTLTAGFNPDPYRIPLIAGGDVDAGRLGAPCSGWIAQAPDVELTYFAGAFPLILSAASAADATLVVAGPDGFWACDDDGGSGTNPSIRYDAPATGRYAIWVGVRGGRPAEREAALSISELVSE